MSVCVCTRAMQSICRGYQGARPLTRTHVDFMTQIMIRKAVMAAEVRAKRHGSMAGYSPGRTDLQWVQPVWLRAENIT